MAVSNSLKSTPRKAPRRDDPVAPRDRRPRTQKTRRRLLDAGRTLFAQHGGPDAVTTHTIAAEAGYAAGTFYLHFKDKHSLFHELAEEAATELEDRVLSAANESQSATEIMQAQAEALVGFAEEKRDLLLIVFHPSQVQQDATGDSAADSIRCSVGAGILERLAQGLAGRRRQAVAEGRAEDCFNADVLAQAIVGMWAHVLAWWCEDPSRATREDLIRTLTHFQLHGNRSEDGLCGLPSTPSSVDTQPGPPPKPTKT
ncbi:MAG: TetR/AcrR family transcriptional regulator [Myxococcota bacterium]